MSKNVGKWLAECRSGMSSLALASASLGYEGWKSAPAYPHDSDDFGRCILFYGFVPESKDGLARLSAVSGQWKRIAENWDKLIDLYEADRSACSKLISKLTNPNDLRMYQERKGEDGLWDIHPYSSEPGGSSPTIRMKV